MLSQLLDTTSAPPLVQSDNFIVAHLNFPYLNKPLIILANMFPC